MSDFPLFRVAFIAFIVGAFATVVISIFRQLSRQRRLPAFAASLGFTYDMPVRMLELIPGQPLPFIPVCGFKPVGWISNLMRGATPVGPMAICDYQTAEMDDPRQTLFCLDVGVRDIPSMAITPRGSLMSHRIGRHAATLAESGPAAFDQLVGPPMTESAVARRSFDTAPVVPAPAGCENFDRQFEIRAHDARAAARLVTPEVVAHFERHASLFPHLVTTDRWIVLYERRRLTPMGTLPTMLNETQQVFRSLR